MLSFSFEKLDLAGAILIQNFYVNDNRGDFTKCFEKDIFKNAGIDFSVNETFVSISSKNVIRGMHFQYNKPQAKLVNVLKGCIFDVIIDLRKDSDTFGEWRGFELSGEKHNALYVPPGFAHGFVALEEETYVMYQCAGAYDKETDSGIRFDDADLAIKWPIDTNIAIVSQRDLMHMSFKEYLNSGQGFNEL